MKKKLIKARNTLFWSLPHHLRLKLSGLFLKKEIYKKQYLRIIKAREKDLVLKGFDDYKCIFVHIPKTGGVSIKTALFNNLGGGHRTIERYQLIFTKEEFKEYYKFAFVRNPWDRLVSAYFFLKSGGFNIKNKTWFDDNLAIFKDFSEFVENWLTEDNIRSMVHFIPQYEFVTKNGKLLVDDIFKFENIKEGIEIVEKKLNLKLVLEHKNRTHRSSSDYRDYYNDRTKEIVGSIYKTDNKMFNYTF